MNWNRIAVVGIAAAALATAFLVGRGSAGSSSHDAASTTSTSAGNVTTSVSTATTKPVAATTTSSPRTFSPPDPRVIPSIPQISLELSRTVEIADGTTHFSAGDDPVTVSDGAGGWLTGIIGFRFPTADGKGQLVFFWHNTTFVGLDSHTESNQIMRLSATGPGTLAVQYTHYASTDALCCPSLAPVTIDYQWDGHAMTPSGLPPGHRAGEAATITTLP